MRTSSPKDKTNDYWQKAPTGTGPFMFAGDFVSGDHYTIVKNPNYWDTANAAHLDKIIFKPIAESTNRLTALQSGTVDTIDFVDPTQTPTVSSRLEPPAHYPDRRWPSASSPSTRPTSRSTTSRSARRSPTRSTRRPSSTRSSAMAPARSPTAT